MTFTSFRRKAIKEIPLIASKEIKKTHTQTDVEREREREREIYIWVSFKMYTEQALWPTYYKAQDKQYSHVIWREFYSETWYGYLKASWRSESIISACLKVASIVSISLLTMVNNV